MLDIVYRLGRLLMTRGWVVGLTLIAITIGFGTIGFLDEKFDKDTPHSFLDALYKAASLLAIQTGSLPTSENWRLELARWCGLLFFATALITFVIRLTRETVHRVLVRLFAKDHIIVAGLGANGVLLVEVLRRRKRTVVVIEANQNHPAVEQCRRAGAIVMFGEPSNANTLLAAHLPYAATILALFGTEEECVRIATAAYDVLHSERATPRNPPVRCVLRITEPGLLDVIRSHRIKADAYDRLELEILNAHEIAASNMVREARAITQTRTLRKIMILGLGTQHRLGEMVVLRAAKDHLIINDGQIAEKLIINVYDNEATGWYDAIHSRYPFLDRVCTLTAKSCWAQKVGGVGFSRDYDAAFVCMSDEGHATAQAVMLRREVLTNHEPIMVRVRHSKSGYGGLMAYPDTGWGAHIYPVGLDDALFEADTATHPEMELRAQTIQHDLRARQEDRNAESGRPWGKLHETYRAANRKLAERYAAHLLACDGVQKKVRYVWVFRADGFTRTTPGERLLFAFSDSELEFLAAREHQLWKDEREQDGWRYGPVKDTEQKTHPKLVEYSKLDDETRATNREFVRRIPLILALADYAIAPMPEEE